jgi:hypothetical protein
VSAPQPSQCKPAAPEPEAPTDAELTDLLLAVETAYEAAWHLADVGVIYFGPFEGLPRALRLLRALRDERRRAA